MPAYSARRPPRACTSRARSCSRHALFWPPAPAPRRPEVITVHHLNNSRSQRVLWLLEELGCPYEIVKYQRDPHTLLAPAQLKRVHPLGKSPVITDGAHTIGESGAILEYLLDTYGAGRLRPQAGSEARLRYTYWLHYAEGSAMP